MVLFAALAVLAIQASNGGTSACNRMSRAYLGDRACVRFDPPRMLEGVWINQAGASDFVEGARDMPAATARRRQVWLTIDDQSRATRRLRQPDGHAYRVRFIGWTAHEMHRKPFEDGYGHRKGSAGLVLVDRMIEAVDLGRAPRSGR